MIVTLSLSKLNANPPTNKGTPMNKIFPIILLLSIAVCLLSCKSDQNRQVKETGEIVLDPAAVDQFTAESSISKGVRIIKNMRDKVTPQMVEDKVAEATGILQYRYKEQGTKSWQILTANYWEYQYIFGGDEMSKPGELDGRWIKFEDDLTYEYGYYQDKQGSGRYHYSLDSGLLLLVDNNPKIKPNEYEVNMASNICILIGTPVYYDNNFQCKIRGRVDIPAKGASAAQ